MDTILTELTNFKPFDRVLVKNDYHDKWIPALFREYDNINNLYITIGGDIYKHCISFNGNEDKL